MKLGYMTNGFGPLVGAGGGVTSVKDIRYLTICDDADTIAKIANVGFRCIEVLEGNLTKYADNIDELKQILQSNGVEMMSVCVGANFIYKDALEDELAHIEAVARMAKAIGVTYIGICGGGIIDIISELYRCGIVNAKGLFIREGERVRRDHHGMGRYVIAFENESETGREVSINEVDIDNFIRAKGAIFSAIATLLQSVDMPVEAIENVYVAGGIGSGINMKNAVNIGMFPDVELEKFHYIGNSSLAGAYAMVMSDEAAAKTAEVAANMTYLELSTYPGYMDSFVAACFLPHTDKRLFPHSIQEA